LSTDPVARKAAWFQGVLTVLGLTVLWLRVGLESAIVLFNVAMTLQSIDQKTKAR
jgi:hypothetical protein